MFASLQITPPDGENRVPCTDLLNSHYALRPALMNEVEGAPTRFDPSSLSDYFNERPDGVHTSQEIEAMRLRALISPR